MRRRRAVSTMLSRTSGASSTCDARALEHRLELLAHDADTAARRAAPRRCSPRAAARVSSAPQRATQRATSQRGCECCSASASIGSARRRRARRDRVALAIDPAQHRVHQLARADAVPALRELHRLRDRRVRRHAAHEQQLIDAEAQEVDQVGIELRQPAAHAVVEQRVEPAAPAQHPVHELLRPPPVARDRAGSCAARTTLSSSSPRAGRRSTSAAATRASVTRATHRHRGAPGRRSPVEHPRARETTAPRPRAAACGPRGRRAVPARRRAASRSPCAPDLRGGDAGVHQTCRPHPAPSRSHASDAVPTPASTITGTVRRCLIVRIANG